MAIPTSLNWSTYCVETACVVVNPIRYGNCHFNSIYVTLGVSVFFVYSLFFLSTFIE